MVPLDARRDYDAEPLEPTDLPDDPVEAFREWLAEHERLVGEDANAVVLATADPDTDRPSARTVLLRGIDGDRFVFYTNRESRKGRELAANPQATIICSWVSVHRQIHVEGRVTPTDDETSDRYFAGRPRQSQLSAWASEQSRPITDRTVLDEAYAAAERRFDGRPVERPPHWGGYALVPDRFEFWSGRPGRLHDRIEYLPAPAGWSKRRLAP